MIRSRSKARYGNIDLSTTWFFRLSSLAFISLAVPLLGVPLRGLVGFFILIYLALLAGLADGSLNPVMRGIRKGVANNKLLVFFAIWYAAGVLFNIMLRGNNLSDWRLMMAPVVLLAGIFYAFGFISSDPAYRKLQIVMIIALGVQSLFTLNQLIADQTVIRRMFLELQGAWRFGTQNDFGNWAVILPILLWRAFSERGALRTVLLGATILVGVTAFISSFATPVVLLVLGGIVAGGFLLFVSIRGLGRLQRIALVLAIIIIGVLLYQQLQTNSFLSASNYRITNFLNDPRSGGYAGADTLGSRWLKAEISIRSFRANPFFGAGGGSTYNNEFLGGHSAILDNLGAYGLLGGGGALLGLFLTMLYTAIRRFRRYRDAEGLAAVTVAILLLVVSIINPYGAGSTLMLSLIMARLFDYLPEERRSPKQQPVSVSHGLLGIRARTSRQTPHHVSLDKR